MKERYSIEVHEDYVIVYGDLTIEETFDFLNFYERKGYKTVTLGQENSTLLMIKTEMEKIKFDKEENEIKHSEKMYEQFYEDECKKHIQTMKELDLCKYTLKDLQDKFHEKYSELSKDYKEACKQLRIFQLENNDEFLKILDNANIGCDPKGTEIEPARKIPDFVPLEPGDSLKDYKDYYVKTDPTKE